METECDHLVGYIPGGEVKAGDWNEKMMDFILHGKSEPRAKPAGLGYRP